MKTTITHIANKILCGGDACTAASVRGGDCRGFFQEFKLPYTKGDIPEYLKTILHCVCVGNKSWIISIKN